MNKWGEWEFVRTLAQSAQRVWKCPICGGRIVASGFSGRLFCWGKCYCYLGSEKYHGLLSEL